jgi:CBS domain-containing protein
MIATTEPLLALTASDVMSQDVVTISQDTSLRAAAELFLRRQVGEAAVVDADGRCVGMLSATDLLRWALQGAGGPEDVPPACPYQVKRRLLTGVDAVICIRAPGSCPLQEMRPMTGGRHTAICLLREGVVSDWQEVSRDGHASDVRRYLTADATVEAEAPLSALARAVADAHVHRLIVVDGQHRPIGTVSRLDVLAALVRPSVPQWGGDTACRSSPGRDRSGFQATPEHST